MARIYKTTIRAIALAAACSLCFSLAIAAAKPAVKVKPQGLWVGGYYYFSDFQKKALQQGGTPKANLAFASASYFAPLSMTFDRHENLWVSFQGVDQNQIAPALEFSRGDLTLSNNRKYVKSKPIITLQGNSPPRSIAFDSDGDLWITDGGSQRLLELLPSQIERSGAPTPAVSITSNNFVPEVIRFDDSNNLWMSILPLLSNPSGAVQLWRFTPADRGASGPANPSLVVNLPDGITPVDLAFDSSGNLWLAGAGVNGDSLEMISASDLSGSGTISPSAAVTLTSSAFGILEGSGSCLGGIDFARSGDLWVSVGDNNADCQADGQLVSFTPTQLSTGGNLVPSVTIGQNSDGTNLLYPGPIRFGPTTH